jgi:16S rRNA (guanine966-N2)-methyltransferase
MIHAPGNLPVRPTTDYAKTGLFNILNNRIDFEGLQVLDLFAGAGGVTFEFASRGATEVTSIDRHHACVRFIQEEARHLGLQAIRAIKADVFRYLRGTSRPYELVFADPPFDMAEREELVRLVMENGWIGAGGWFILEHPSSEDSLWETKGETRRYGNCSFTFFRPAGTPAES